MKITSVRATPLNLPEEEVVASIVNDVASHALVGPAAA